MKRPVPLLKLLPIIGINSQIQQAFSGLRNRSTGPWHRLRRQMIAIFARAGLAGADFLPSGAGRLDHDV